MSLIHEALKKAQEQEKARATPGMARFQDDAAGEKKPFPMRTVALAGALTLVVGYFAYDNFFSKSKNISTPTTAVQVQLGFSGIGDVARLKKNGIDAYRADDMDAAWTALSTAAELGGKDPEIWNNLGLVARKRGDVAKAREYYQKALDIKSDYPEALNNLAVLEMQAGNNDKAKDLLDKAVAITPSYAEANFHLALLYEQKGDKSKSVEFYKRFLASAKDFPSSFVDTVRNHVMEIEPR